MAISNPGGLLNSVPAAQKQALPSNYLDLSTSAGWGQQYVPDLMEKEAEVFGPRTISGFLSQVGAEESMTADQVIWSEQGRLHLSYKGHIHDKDATGGGDIDIEADIDETSGFTAANHGIRVNDTVIVANSEAVAKCLVIEVANAVITVSPYNYITLEAAGFSTQNGVKDTTILVYGSEYAKGKSYVEAGGSTVTDRRGANEPAFKSFSNKPIIMKDLSLIHI